MKHTSILALLAALIGACETGLDPSHDGGDAPSVATSTAALQGPYGTVSPLTHKMGLIGVQQSGTITWRCSGVFMQSNWMLTAASCAAAVPFGAKLVVTKMETGVASTSQTFDVLQRSPMAGNRDIMMVRFSGPALGVPVHTLRSTPVGPGEALYCYGFSRDGAAITLGRRLVTPLDPTAATFSVQTGFGETSHELDTGGVCMVGDAVAGVMRHVFFGSFEVMNLARTGAAGIRMEIDSAPAAYLATAPLGIWPVAFQAASTSRCLQGAPNATGTLFLTMADCGPLWAQGFISEVISSTATTTDSRLRHRGTGRCLQFSIVGFTLATCLQGSSSQRFRTTYQSDGSIRIRNLGWPVCLGSSGSQVTFGTCSNTASSQQWYQGFGVM